MYCEKGKKGKGLMDVSLRWSAAHSHARHEAGYEGALHPTYLKEPI